MAFVPTLAMVVWIPQRPETTAIVKGIDLVDNEMWLEPFTGGQKYTATISDRWAEVRRGQTPEMWLVGSPNRWFGPSGQVVGFASQADAVAAVNANPNIPSVRILHIFTDGSTSTSEVI